MMMAFYRHVFAMLCIDILFIRKWIEAGIDYSQRRILFGVELMVVVRECRKRHHVMAEQTREERKAGNWRTGKSGCIRRKKTEEEKAEPLLIRSSVSQWQGVSVIEGVPGLDRASPWSGSCPVPTAVSVLRGRRMTIVVHAQASSKTQGLRLNIQQCKWLPGW